jgi:hypothetical protein
MSATDMPSQQPSRLSFAGASRVGAFGCAAMIVGLTAAVLWARLPQTPHAAVQLEYANAPARAQSPLTPASARFDFGAVPAGTIVRHSFLLRNTTPEPVEITYVAVSCTCTRASATPMSIPPGKSTKVSVEYFPPFDLRGTYHDAKEAFVYVKGYPRPAAALEVAGSVLCPITAQPDRLFLGRVTAGSPVKRKLTLYLDKASHLSVTSARSTTPEYLTASVSVPTTSKHGFRTQTLVAGLSPRCPVGELNAQIKLRTSDGHALTVAVFGIIDGPFEADPDVLYFGQVQRGDNRPLEFRLRSRSGRIIRVRSVRSDNPDVLVSYPPDGRREVVSVRLAKSAPPGELHAKVTVVLAGSASALVVPVFAYIE